MYSNESLRTLHREAVWRRRRVIFNNDGNDITYADKEPTPEGMLGVRAVPVTGTHVDTMFYNTNVSFGSSYLDLENTDLIDYQLTSNEEHSGNIAPELIAGGTDPLKIMCEYCRGAGIEIFSSIRMNDTHDAIHPEKMSSFKRAHPECLCGTPDEPPPTGFWSSVDYAHPLVQEKAFAFIDEICRSYDIDGVELDFWRHPPYFRSHAWGDQVSQKESDAMTDLVRRLRKSTLEIAERRGKPLLMAVRTVETLAMSAASGLDVLRWLQEGLLDLLIVGEQAVGRWGSAVALGHDFGIPVYPCIVRSYRRFCRENPDHGSDDGYRARAMQAWGQGADGVYLFNLFPERPQDFDIDLLNQVGEPKILDGLDKRYFLDDVGVQPKDTRYSHRFPTYFERPIVSPFSPCPLVAGLSHRFPIFIGDALDQEGAAAPEVTVFLRLKDGPGLDALKVRVNEAVLSGGAVEDDQIRYPCANLRHGNNFVEITPTVHGHILLDIEVAVRYSARTAARAKRVPDSL